MMRCDRQARIDGTQQAARSSQGQGLQWTIDQLHVLPRSHDEGAVMYEIRLSKAGAAATLARALFLETWVKHNGTWFLKRHRAEKVSYR